MRNYKLKFNRHLLLVFSLGLIVLGVIAAMLFIQMGEDPVGALYLSGSGTSYALMAGGSVTKKLPVIRYPPGFG